MIFDSKMPKTNAKKPKSGILDGSRFLDGFGNEDVRMISRILPLTSRDRQSVASYILEKRPKEACMFAKHPKDDEQVAQLRTWLQKGKRFNFRRHRRS